MPPRRSIRFEKSISLNLKGCATATNLLRIITYDIYLYMLFQLIITKPFNFMSFTILLMFPSGMFLIRYGWFSRLPRQAKNFMFYFFVGGLFLVNWLLALMTQGQIPPPDSSSTTLFLMLFFFYAIWQFCAGKGDEISAEAIEKMRKPSNEALQDEDGEVRECAQKIAGWIGE